MADSVKHSPTPWRIVNNTLIGADGQTVPFTPENCAYLMQAVNAHDDLVAALKAFVTTSEATISFNAKDRDNEYNIARAKSVLAQAGV